MSRSANGPIAVLDTSVLVPAWSRLVLQRLGVAGLFRPAWSEWIVAETWRVLAWRWFRQARQADETEWRALTRSANQMLRHLIPVMRLVSLRDYSGPEPWPDLADRDDEPIWATAVVADARYVISQNVNDFPPQLDGRHRFAGVECVTAMEFRRDVLGEDPEEIYGAPLPLGSRLRSARQP